MTSRTSRSVTGLKSTGKGPMSLDKAIEHGKEKRRPYRGAARFSQSCRHGGSCGWCEGNRTIKDKRKVPVDVKEQLRRTDENL